MGFVKEFREFAVRGNVVDMAVGIIIGAAFGKVVSSVVADVIMPPVGLLVGGLDFKDYKVVLKEGVPASEGVKAVDAVTLNYGLFIQTLIDFTIVAFAVFLLVKGINMLKRKEQAKPAPPPGPTPTEKLLGEIRDVLKAR